MFELYSEDMPVRLGSPLRVPSYAYSDWGLTPEAYREDSDLAYELEWRGGSPQQMQYVVDAVVLSGMGNFSQMLRDANATTVSRLARDMPRREKVRILETGAGKSTETLYERLERDGYDLGRFYLTLLEPSLQRLEDTAKNLEAKGLKRGRDFECHEARDVDVLDCAANISQDILCSVAAIHHHAYLDRPVQALASATKSGGFIVLADWHNSMWVHPNRVYEFLKSFEWPSKKSDLDKLQRRYPKASEVSLEKDPMLAEANRMIERFWRAWSEIRTREIQAGRFDYNDDFYMLEGHRPVDRYIEELIAAGFKIDAPYIEGTMARNPFPLLPTSDILQVTVGQKMPRRH